MKSASGFELYVILSDQCNFRCSHCINSSGPNAKSIVHTPQDIETLISTIHSTPSIKILHFSGGEPTLQLDLIAQIQNRIKNIDLRYAMTTNGSFALKTDVKFRILNEMKFHEMIFSYDKHHAPFIKKENLCSLLQELKSYPIQTAVNLVYRKIEEIAEGKEFVDLGIPVHPTRLVTGGRESAQKNLNSSAADRESDLFDPLALQRSCPSFSDEHRRNSLEKVVYIAGRGFTPCCGPIAFDRLREDAFVYSSQFESYASIPLYQELRTGNFDFHFKKRGIDASRLKLPTACDYCKMAFCQTSSEGVA